MPARINPRDWETLFKPNAPRRGGPLSALANVLIVATVLGVFGFGAAFAYRYTSERSAEVRATQAVQSTVQAAAIVATGTAEASLAGTAEAASAAMYQDAFARGRVVTAGNLRTEPVVIPATITGQVCIGDMVAFLEERPVSGAIWYRVRVTATSEDCAPDRVSAGTVGWVSSLLVSAPEALPDS